MNNWDKALISIGKYLEFQASLYKTPIEFCELKELNLDNIVKVDYKGVKISLAR